MNESEEQRRANRFALTFELLGFTETARSLRDLSAGLGQDQPTQQCDKITVDIPEET
jgi:hypothetical protein